MEACLLCGSPLVPTRPITGHPMVRCRACSFVYAMERDIPEQLYEEAHSEGGSYGDHVAGLRQEIDTGQAPDWMHPWVIDRVKPFGESRMLDLGCGVGTALYIAKRAGWKTTGQDISKNALAHAKALAGSETLEEDLPTIAASGRKFELVTAFNLIEHVPDPLSYLKDVRKVVKDGGMFGVAVPNYDSYGMRHATTEQWLPPFHINFFNLKTLRNALRLASFEMVDHRIRFISLSGFPGSRAKQAVLAPYLAVNAVIGRLNGNGIVALARAV